MTEAAPARVLVVEDEMMVAMLVEDMLTDLGYTVVAVASHIEGAIQQAQKGGFDFAILDLNLNGVKSYEVAEVLRERNVPFLFATGYGEAILPGALKDVPTLQKPFVSQQLESAVSRLLAVNVSESVGR